MGPTNIALVKLFKADRDLRDAQDRHDAAARNVRIQERRLADHVERQRLAHKSLHEQQARAKTMELDIALAQDRVCLQSSGGDGNLIVTVPTGPVLAGDSLCANSEWNVSATVDDAVTRTSVVVHQGVGIRVEKANADNFCK